MPCNLGFQIVGRRTPTHCGVRFALKGKYADFYNCFAKGCNAQHKDWLLGAPPGESTQAIRARCSEARARSTERQGKPNQALAGQEIDLHAGADLAGLQFLQTAAAKLGWSAHLRTLKIARTIAD
jgi:predicted ATPase with chaperone activity